MAINSIDIIRNKKQTNSSCSTNASNSSNISSQLMKRIIGRSKYNKPVKINSPYVTGDKRQISMTKENRLVHKQGSNIISSFPLAAYIYKSNSDEIRLKKRNNKTAKSVLTLPNEPMSKPEVCTVSDINDSEYFNQEDQDRKHKIRKRLPTQNKRRSRIKNKDEFEFYDRDARYCSQMNIHLDCSSSDLINDFNYDEKQYHKKSNFTDSPQTEGNMNPHDVWAVLKNINQFQFRPSPPMSRGNMISPKKRRPLNKKRKHIKDTRVIETRQTEEYSYISNFEVTSESSNLSQSSSFDRITVINKDAKFANICKKFENRSKRQKFIRNTDDNAKVPKRIKKISLKNKKSVYNSKVEGKDIALNSTQIAPPETTESNTININKYIDSCKEMHNNRDKESVKDKSGGSLIRTFKAYNSDQLSLLIKAGHQINEKSETNKDLYRDGNETRSLRYSDSHKVGLRNLANKNIVKKKKVKPPIDSFDEAKQEIKGVTHIVLNETQDVIQSKHDLSHRKRRLTTVPISAMTPKLIQTEIKRKLPCLKFPIVILGKDKLSSSSILVESFESFQFYRLDEQVWPFMMNSYDNKVFSNEDNNSKIDNKDEKGQKKTETNIVSGSVNIHLIKQGLTKDRKSYNNYSFMNKMKTDLKITTLCTENNKRQSHQVKKLNPIRQLRDKVLQLLYKKPSIANVIPDPNVDHNVNEKGDAKKQKHVELTKTLKIVANTKKKDASTETYNEVNLNHDILKQAHLKSLSVQCKNTVSKYPWGKVKRASDFIENIIKKVKSGIYYSEENRGIDNKHYADTSREASIQTNLSMRLKSFNDYIIEENELIPKIITNNNNGNLKKIPGFDDAIQAIEIKTMNVKKLTVKHCFTNVLVEFDVMIATEPKCIALNTGNVSSLVTITNSSTKIFKCKTSILNSVLPAELCCLLPKMMQSIIESSACKHIALPQTLPTIKDGTNLTFNEFTFCDHPDTLPSRLISHITMTKSSNFTALSKGIFLDTGKNKSSINKVMKYSSYNIEDIFTKVDVVLFMPLYIVNPGLTSLMSEQKYNMLPEQKHYNCSAIEPYVPSKRCLIPIAIAKSYMNILQNLCHKDIITNFNALIFPIHIDNIQITVYNEPYNIDNNHVRKSITISISKLKIFNNFMNMNDMVVSKLSSNNLLNTKRIEYDTPNKIEKRYLQNLGSNNIKNKKKCFVRFYKKCKSTTNISGEKTSTSLSKIVTIDDFCQALGSGKSLSNVFEGYVERKIMASIAEMKNWIKEISQRQAMLILLLMNKNDTPNLVRFRPILLQGIAVNRITRASELDMEIEVIEREHVNRRSYHEGISYITSDEQTKDSLLEELYWIAKTTASDYQKPFDESSERQLKSLLEKRKKLNPSYLRVMARYVGLGLLKPQRKRY